MPAIVNIIMSMKCSCFLADPKPERSKLRRKTFGNPENHEQEVAAWSQ